MENTITQGDIIYYGSDQLTITLKILINYYRFMHHNQSPSKIILPIVTEVDGVKIEQAVELKVRRVPSTKKEEVNAVTS